MGVVAGEVDEEPRAGAAAAARVTADVRDGGVHVLVVDTEQRCRLLHDRGVDVEPESARRTNRGPGLRLARQLCIDQCADVRAEPRHPPPRHARREACTANALTYGQGTSPSRPPKLVCPPANCGTLHETLGAKQACQRKRSVKIRGAGGSEPQWGAAV